MTRPRQRLDSSSNTAPCNLHGNSQSSIGEGRSGQKPQEMPQSAANRSAEFSHHPKINPSDVRGFAGLNPDSVDPRSAGAERRLRRWVRWTLEAVDDMLVRSTSAARAAACANLECWPLDRRKRQLLHSLFGAPSHAPSRLASDMTARLIAARQLVASAVELQAARPSLRWYHATLLDDRLRTEEYEPRLDIAKIKKTVRAVMADASIRDWIGTIELLPLVNHKAGRGRLLSPHAHVMFWTDRALDRASLEVAMQASTRLRTYTGAPTVTIAQRIGVAEVAHGLAYLLKGIDRGANEYALSRSPDRTRMRDAAMRPDQALRIMEIMSHLRIGDIMMSSGDGRECFYNPLRAALRRAGCGIADIHRVADLWIECREAAGKTRPRSPIVIR